MGLDLKLSKITILAVSICLFLVGCNDFIRQQGTKPGTLSTIVTSNHMYQQAYGTYAPTLQSLGGNLPCVPSRETACLMDPTLASGHKSGYSFKYAVGERDGKGNITSYSVSAEPDDKDDAWYYTDQTGIIHREMGKKASVNSPVVD